jgi:peptidoglycan/xylan/chitin deacetylase (PgdA/CDA1 family)
MPRILRLLREEDVRGTFFVTGVVARRFPQIVRSIVDERHEIGCHGDTHRRFRDMAFDVAREELARASQALRQFYPVKSFRAPYLDFPPAYLGLLRDSGYEIDSSQGRHKRESLFVPPTTTGGLKRVPASIAPSAIRLPRPIRRRILAQLRAPVVLFFHPWEFIDVSRERIPYDCRYRTGGFALEALRDTIRFFHGRGADFRTMEALF